MLKTASYVSTLPTEPKVTALSVAAEKGV